MTRPAKIVCDAATAASVGERGLSTPFGNFTGDQSGLLKRSLAEADAMLAQLPPVSVDKRHPNLQYRPSAAKELARWEATKAERAANQKAAA